MEIKNLKNPTPEQAIKMVLELLESPYVQDNVQKLGILGASDIECAIKILKKVQHGTNVGEN